MCDYCDCRTRPLLAHLGADHERILTGIHGLRTASDPGDADRRMALAAALRTAAQASEVDPAALETALRRLEAHIHREEYDLFPAAHQVLDDVAWDRIHLELEASS